MLLFERRTGNTFSITKGIKYIGIHFKRFNCDAISRKRPVYKEYNLLERKRRHIIKGTPIEEPLIDHYSINYDTRLLEQIYKNNSYIINYDNIVTMLKLFHPEQNIDELRTESYTIIMKTAQSPLSEYINANIDNYMAVMLTECGESITDTVKNAISLLNNKDIEEDKKKEYISYLKTTILDITEVADRNLWGELLTNPVAIKYSAENIVSYFFEICENKFDDILISYINNKGTAIDLIDCLKKNEEAKLFWPLAKAKLLNNNIYEGFIRQFSCHISELGTKELTLDKLAILDKLGKLKMSSVSLQCIREHYADYLYQFIVRHRHIAEYVSLITEEPTLFVVGEIHELLNANIKAEEKISLVQLTTESISLIGKKYPDIISAHILKHNYDSDDLDYLMTVYSNFEKITREAIMEIISADISAALSRFGDVDIDRRLLSDLFNSNDVSEMDKRNMFKNLAPTANNKELLNWLPCVGSKEFLTLFDEQKRPKFEKSDWNKSLLEIFKARGLIKSYGLDRNGQKYSISRPNKLKPQRRSS